MVFVFTKNIVYDGPDGMPRRAQAGDTIGVADIASGCLASCRRLGILVEDLPVPAADLGLDPSMPETEDLGGPPPLDPPADPPPSDPAPPDPPSDPPQPAPEDPKHDQPKKPKKK